MSPRVPQTPEGSTTTCMGGDRMNERICSERECEKRIHGRGMCRAHYLKALRQGMFVPKPSTGPTHKISNADLQAAVGDCAVCGPGTPIRVRVGRGHECQARRAQDNVERSDESRRRSNLMRYGLTHEDYERLKAKQGGRCAICREPDDHLAVDHDHACCPTRKQSCGACIRGLLCRQCNIALGFLRDNLDIAAAAAAYLR